MRIAFRIDISNEIGTGHFVRMSALAGAFEHQGHTCQFFKGEDEPIDYNGFDIIILDTYQVDDEYIENLNTHGRTVVCYDDNALYNYNCDILLNANLYAHELDFKFSGKTPRLLLGGKYALLRKEFQKSEPITIREKAKNIFICFGGSDLRNMTPRVIETLNKIDGVHLNVILGGHTKFDKEVTAIVNENISVLKTPESISEIMSSCDIAVTSSGSITYELAVLGIPSITIAQADNQFLISEYMTKNNLAKCIGTWETVDFNQLKVEVYELLNDYGRRKSESVRLIQIVDKSGVYNVVSEIIQFL